MPTSLEVLWRDGPDDAHQRVSVRSPVRLLLLSGSLYRERKVAMEWGVP